MPESIRKGDIGQSNILDRSLLSIDIDIVSDLKRFVEKNSYCSKYIGKTFLSSKSNRKSPYPGSGKERIDVIPKTRKDKGKSKYPKKDKKNFIYKTENRRMRRLLCGKSLKFFLKKNFHYPTHSIDSQNSQKYYTSMRKPISRDIIFFNKIDCHQSCTDILQEK